MPKPKNWIDFATGDLVSAKILINEDIALASVFYHSQQCAEKALKGYLLYKRQPIRKTHDLVSLLNESIIFDIEFRTLATDAYDLNPFASVTRYPDDCYLLPSLDYCKNMYSKSRTNFRICSK